MNPPDPGTHRQISDDGVDPRVLIAAANNAAWCDAVCRAHGLQTQLEPRRWWSSVRTPTFYPDAVTLDPALTVAEALDGVDTCAGCSVKDSFATLDLAAAGFRQLFTAEWIFSPAVGRSAPPRGIDSVVVHDESGLQEWLHTWDGAETDIFLPALLEDPDVRLVSVTEGGEQIGVAALNRSADAVGISNLVCEAPRAVQVWTAVAALATELFPGLDLVGYEQQQDLDPARATGFRTVGPLRVWMA